MQTWSIRCSAPTVRRDFIVEAIAACCATRSASVVSLSIRHFTPVGCVLQPTDLGTANLSEKNKKRDVRNNWYYEPTLAREGVDQRHQEVPTDTERGDIPIMHGDCEGKQQLAIFLPIALITQQSTFHALGVFRLSVGWLQLLGGTVGSLRRCS